LACSGIWTTAIPEWLTPAATFAATNPNKVLRGAGRPAVSIRPTNPSHGKRQFNGNRPDLYDLTAY
jgi:hypothetical protein